MLVVLEINPYVVVLGGRNIDGHGEAGWALTLGKTPRERVKAMVE